MRHPVQLWSTPGEGGTWQGTLIVEATPGQGLRAYYLPAQGGPEIGFTPDLFDADWGYGPFFHQTFLERRGKWFLLPAGPFPHAVWINAAELADEPDLRLLRAGEIVKFQGDALVVLGIEHDVVRARRERASDMPCEERDQLLLAPSKEVRISVRKLYGPTGHLLADIKYKRGC